MEGENRPLANERDHHGRQGSICLCHPSTILMWILDLKVLIFQGFFCLTDCSLLPAVVPAQQDPCILDCTPGIVS